MNTFSIVVVALFLAVLLAAWVLALVQQRRAYRQQQIREQEFVQSLWVQLKNSSLRSLEDVRDSYCSFFRYPDSLDLDHERVNLYLKRLKSIVSSSHTSLLPSGASRDNMLSEVDKLITANKPSVDEQIERRPFSGVPDDAREILENILDICQSYDSVKANLKKPLRELASIIRSRQHNIDQLTDQIARSRKATWWALVATLAFGATSLALLIWGK